MAYEVVYRILNICYIQRKLTSIIVDIGVVVVVNQSWRLGLEGWRNLLVVECIVVFAFDGNVLHRHVCTTRLNTTCVQIWHASYRHFLIGAIVEVIYYLSVLAKNQFFILILQ